MQHKRDKKRHTGAEGGKHLEYSAVNLKVLEILGESSPIVEGLDVQESSAQFVGIVEPSQLTPQNSRPTCNDENLSQLLVDKRKRKATSKDLMEIDELKLENLKLEIELNKKSKTD